MNSLLYFRLFIFQLELLTFCRAVLNPYMPQPGFVEAACTYADHPICCEAIDPKLGYYPRKQSPQQLVRSPSSSSPSVIINNHHHCNLTVEYIPSPYEQKHMAAAERIGRLSNESDRLSALIDFIWHDIPDSSRWTMKVVRRSKMIHDGNVSEADDMQYLSRFHYRQSCGHASTTKSHSSSIHGHPSSSHVWDEWIEPLSVHARHPFGIVGGCLSKHFKYDKQGNVHWPDKNLHHKIDSVISGTIFDTAYVLMARDEEVKLRSSLGNSGNSNNKSKQQQQQQNKRHSSSSSSSGGSSSTSAGRRYLLDAGTSRFDSSMWWFVCAYTQRGVAFNHLYGWEVTKIPAEDFWSRVPPAIMPHYSFYNYPVSAKENDGNSAVRLLKQTAREEDFVSFKLDIDTATVELPIALQLLRDPGFYRLVDEFFFELHFLCEIMLNCGWTRSEIPGEFDGLKLQRYEVMKLFQDLRFQGVRSHFWV